MHIDVVINWQLSKQGISWPVSLDRILGSAVDPSRSSIFWSFPLTSYYSIQMIAVTSLIFFNSYEICCVMCRTIKILISNCPRTRKIQPAITGREDICFWLFSPWSRDLLARFCKVNLSNEKKLGLICFPGLIYSDRQSLRLVNVIVDYCYFRVYISNYQLDVRFGSLLDLAVCKLLFSKIT